MKSEILGVPHSAKYYEVTIKSKKDPKVNIVLECKNLVLSKMSGIFQLDKSWVSLWQRRKADYISPPAWHY